MVLEKLADIYYVRDDYEACGQVLDMQAKVLDHCKRHSSVPGAAHDLMPFCEKTGYHMLSTQHSLNEKFGRHEENIPIFRKLYEYEATHDIPPQYKVNTNMWKSSASLYNATSRQTSEVNVNSIRGLSDKTILKVILSTMETERFVRSLDIAASWSHHWVNSRHVMFARKLLIVGQSASKSIGKSIRRSALPKSRKSDYVRGELPTRRWRIVLYIT